MGGVAGRGIAHELSKDRLSRQPLVGRAGKTGFLQHFFQCTHFFALLKESLNRPASHAVSSALGTSFGQQKSNLPTPGQKQVAHNQTQGVVSRVNVPRRTAG
jgi:hypothetical protein